MMNMQVYDGRACNGRSVTLRRSVPDFVILGFATGTVHSAAVHTETWIVYENPRYEGRSYKISKGKYDANNLQANIGSDTISSGKLAPLITLYQHGDFTGTAVHLTESDPDFSGINDETSSVIVTRGTWILYEHYHFKGKSMELKPGKYGYHEIRAGIGNDKASSAKLLAREIILYEEANCRGKDLSLTNSTPNLVGLDFDDRTSSILVVSGTWTVYEHAEYKGRSKQLSKGFYDHGQISSFIGNESVSSVKFVSD